MMYKIMKTQKFMCQIFIKATKKNYKNKKIKNKK